MNGLSTRRRKRIALALVLLIAAIGGAMFAPGRHMRRVKALQAQLNFRDPAVREKLRNMPREKRDQLFQTLMTERRKLTPKDRAELERPRQEAERKRLKDYFAMSPEDRAKYLKDLVDKEKEWRKQREQRRQQAGNRGNGSRGGQAGNRGGGPGGGRGGPGGAGGGPGGRGGPGGAGGGPGGGGGMGGGPGGGRGGWGGPGGPGGRGDPSARNARAAQRLDATDPTDRAMAHQFRFDLQQARIAAGLPAGGGRGGFGGFGGPRGPR